MSRRKEYINIKMYYMLLDFLRFATLSALKCAWVIDRKNIHKFSFIHPTKTLALSVQDHFYTLIFLPIILNQLGRHLKVNKPPWCTRISYKYVLKKESAFNTDLMMDPKFFFYPQTACWIESNLCCIVWNSQTVVVKT